MTQKFIGEIEFYCTADSVKVHKMPSGTAIPPKQEWSKHAIWEFNGKAYKPLTQKAEDSLNLAIATVQKSGFSKATKLGKRKPTSIRYAILTFGVEPFYFIK